MQRGLVSLFFILVIFVGCIPEPRELPGDPPPFQPPMRLCVTDVMRGDMLVVKDIVSDIGLQFERWGWFWRHHCPTSLLVIDVDRCDIEVDMHYPISGGFSNYVNGRCFVGVGRTHPFMRGWTLRHELGHCPFWLADDDRPTAMQWDQGIVSDTPPVVSDRFSDKDRKYVQRMYCGR